jgi:hypothetical protein
MNNQAPEKSLKDEYELLLKKARQFNLEKDASRLKNSYSSIIYHSSNPDEDVRKQTMEHFKKTIQEVKEKIGEIE